MKNATSALRAIQRKSSGPKESSDNKDQEDLETKEKLTQELLSTANKQYNKAMKPKGLMQLTNTSLSAMQYLIKDWRSNSLRTHYVSAKTVG
jgi:hypothetical protein